MQKTIRITRRLPFKNTFVGQVRRTDKEGYVIFENEVKGEIKYTYIPLQDLLNIGAVEELDDRWERDFEGAVTDFISKEVERSIKRNAED